MSQVTEQSVRFQTALASIKLIQASAVLDLTEDDFDFLTSNKVWIATDRSRARRCVEACVYGTLDFVGSPRFPARVEFIADVIAYYVHPVNIQTACLIMEGAEFTENIINGVERPVKAAFFFQAEDGIRDSSVTGVQTCALPIYEHDRGRRGGRYPRHHPEAAGHLHREGGQAQVPGQGRNGLPDRRHLDRRDRHRGHPDRKGVV